MLRSIGIVNSCLPRDVHTVYIAVAVSFEQLV